VRYADDWICTASSREILEQEVLPTVISFLKERGLELSKEKTLITHINEGFNFLGFNLRKYKNKLLIKPGKKGIKTFLDNIRETIISKRASKTENLIYIFNSKIQGWVNHYRHVVAKKIFANIDSSIFKSLWAWAKRRHPNKCLQWIKDKYFTRINQRDWIFFSHQGGKTKDESRLTLKFAASTRIIRHVKIKADANPYDPNFKSYFQERKLKQRMSKYSRAPTGDL
jgi:RNA-directed DNA polymerase